MNNPIVDEVTRVRDAHAARFNDDLHAIFLDIKKREKERGLNFVNGVARQQKPNNTLQMTEATFLDSPDPESLDVALEA